MKPRTKNHTIYRARFSGLRVHLFSTDQVVACEMEIEIYQARVSPEKWRARPQSRHTAQWWAGSAEHLMEMIPSYFERTIEPWARVPDPKPTLQPRQPATIDRLPLTETIQ